MLSAFVHFAPEDRNPKLPSDNWLVENCTIDNVDRVYGYDIERGGWQTGQPAKRLRFVDVKATGLAGPLRVLGDAQRQFELTLEGVTLAFREDQQDQPLLDLTRFGTLVLRNAPQCHARKQRQDARPARARREHRLARRRSLASRSRRSLHP